MKHYSLIHDMPTHYIVHDSRDKRVFEIAKHGLDEDTHEQLRNLPPMKQFKGYDNDQPSDKNIPGTDSTALKDQPQKKTNPGNTENYPKSVDQRSVEEQPQHYSQGGHLTSEHRNNLADKTFALPSERKYPINDINHARNALARASQHASPSQQSQIKSAVHKKFPSIQQASEGGKIHDRKNLEQLKKDFATFISEEEKENYVEGGEIDTKPNMEGTQLDSPSEAPLDIYTPTPLPTPEEEHGRHVEVPETREESHANGGVIGNETSASASLKEKYDTSKSDRDSRIDYVKEHHTPAPAIGKQFHFADGTPPGGVPDKAGDLSNHDKLVDTLHKLAGAQTKEPEMNLSASDVDPNAVMHVPQNQPKQDITPQINQALAEKNPTPEESAANLAAVVPGAQQPQAQTPQLSEDPTQAVQPQQQPASPQQTQQPAAPQQQAPPPGQQAAPQSNLDTLLAQSQQAYQHLIEERRADDQRFGALVASKTIDPNRYFNNQNLGQKLAAGLGMGLASVGAAVSHMPNQAMQVMSDAINRDIDAQKNDQSNAINLWKMNHQSLGDDMAATLQTRNQMLEAAKVKMDELLGSAPGPMAQQKAAALKTQIQLEQEQNNAAITQTKMRQNFLNSMTSTGGSPLNNGRPLDAKDLAMAGIMAPEQAEKEQASLEAQHAKVNAAKNVFNQINAAQTVSNRVLNPLQSSSDINQLNAQLATIVQDADPSKRLTPVSYEQEIAPFKVKLSDDSTRVQHKLQGVLNIIKTHESAGTPTVEKYSPRALPNYTAGSFDKNQQALNWANQNPNDPRAQEIKTRLGVK